jgi:hypothetical protein
MAARFWVGGTGTWDNADTTHWAASTGGASGASVPGSSDTVTFDANSGGGTVTVNHATLSIGSITWGAFTGTIDFSANNNNVTLVDTNNAFSGTGTGTRTFHAGSGTWTMTAANPSWELGTTTNLDAGSTFNNCTIILGTGTQTAQKNFSGGGRSYGTLTIPASTGVTVAFFQANTISTLNIDDKNHVSFPNGTTQTIATLNITGSTSTPVLIDSSSAANATLALTTANITGAAIGRITFTGSPTASNSYDIGGNSGITINAPAAGGASGVIGS